MPKTSISSNPFLTTFSLRTEGPKSSQDWWSICENVISNSVLNFSAV